MSLQISDRGYKTTYYRGEVEAILVGFDKFEIFVKSIPQEIENRFEVFLEHWAHRLCEYAKTHHKWESRSGDLEKSHYVEKKGKLHWFFGVDTRREGHFKNYAYFLEKGARQYKPPDKWAWIKPTVDTHVKPYQRSTIRVLKKALMDLSK